MSRELAQEKLAASRRSFEAGDLEAALQLAQAAVGAVPDEAESDAGEIFAWLEYVEEASDSAASAAAEACEPETVTRLESAFSVEAESRAPEVEPSAGVLEPPAPALELQEPERGNSEPEDSEPAAATPQTSLEFQRFLERGVENEPGPVATETIVEEEPPPKAGLPPWKLGTVAVGLAVCVAILISRFSEFWDRAHAPTARSVIESKPPQMVFQASRSGPIQRDELRLLLDQAAREEQLLPESAEISQPVQASAAPAREVAAKPGPRPKRYRSPRSGRKPNAAVSPVDTGAPSIGGRYFGGSGAVYSQSKSRAAALPLGTVLQAELEVAVASIQHGEILAKLTKPVKVGSVRLKKGARLVGRSSDGHDRIYMQFTGVQLPSQKLLPIKAIAVSADDMRGLPGQVRTASTEDRQAASVAEGTTHVAADLAAAALGPAGSAVNRAVGGAVDEAAKSRRVSNARYLVVPAKTRFKVVVIP